MIKASFNSYAVLCAPQRSIIRHLEITCGPHQSENGTPGQSGDETNGSIISIAASKLAPYRPQHRLHPVSAREEVGLETLIHLQSLEK